MTKSFHTELLDILEKFFDRAYLQREADRDPSPDVNIIYSDTIKQINQLIDKYTPEIKSLNDSSIKASRLAGYNSKNKDLGLPFGKMQKIKIAFDVDGTLRCNCTETCKDPNLRIVQLFSILDTFKNVELYVWSGGGSEYALGFARLYSLPVKPKNCISKFDAPSMDIAIDDIQDTAIGKINLIVREK